jgi:ribosomal protein S18 acetylase RimI-like enzyme
MIIEKIANEQDKIFCAEQMSSSEPWITLQRSFEQSLQCIDDPLSEVFLAKCDNQMVGFAIIKLRGAFTGYIQSILIFKECQRMGYGHKFISLLEEYIFSRCPNVFICASSFNPGALKLYQESGYKMVGELTDYIVARHSEILLRKSIAPINDFNLNHKSQR